jgi:hypothetical protein
MKFVKGQSGNPGGRKRSLGLSRSLRKAAGLEAWAMAMKVLRGELKEPYFNKETKKTEWLEPGSKARLEAVKIILAYTWGTPVPVGNDELERRINEVEEVLKAKGTSAWGAH